MVNNDYLACEGYSNRPASENFKGFSVFTDEATSKFFFALTDKKGKVLLRSEGYPAEKARKTGLESVIKNSPMAERYSVAEEAGKFYVILKAGNKKEIARSCDLASKKEADTLLKSIIKTAAAYEAEWSKPTEKVEAKPVAKAEVKPEIKAEEPKKTKPAAKKVVEKIEEKPAPVAKKATKPAKKETTVTFLNDEAYLGHPTIGETGYAAFEGNDAKFYFSVYEFDGSIFQRSAGFDSQEVRDTQLEALQSAIINEDSYQITEIDGKYYTIIVDAQGKELSRSVAFDSYIQALLKTPKGWKKEEFVGTMY